MKIGLLLGLTATVASVGMDAKEAAPPPAPQKTVAKRPLPAKVELKKPRGGVPGVPAAKQRPEQKKVPWGEDRPPEFKGRVADPVGSKYTMFLPDGKRAREAATAGKMKAPPPSKSKEQPKTKGTT